MLRCSAAAGSAWLQQAALLALRLVSDCPCASADPAGLRCGRHGDEVVTGFIGLFKSLGLGTATIQAPHVTHAQLNGLFWINVAFGAWRRS